MKVHIKVWTSDLKECETFVYPCSPGIKDKLVKAFVANLEEKFPNNTFRTVPLGQHRYNVIPESVHLA